MFGVGRRSLSTTSKLAHIKEIKLNSDTDKQIRPEIYSTFKKKNTHASF